MTKHILTSGPVDDAAVLASRAARELRVAVRRIAAMPLPGEAADSFGHSDRELLTEAVELARLTLIYVDDPA